MQERVEFGCELFDEFIKQARAASMSMDEPGLVRAIWRRLDIEQKRAAIDGIRNRILNGEYSDPRYVPRAVNYLRRRIWEFPLRRPVPSAPPSEDCPLCRGTGYIVELSEDQVEWARKCSCSLPSVPASSEQAPEDPWEAVAVQARDRDR